jgi:hypothetical protein
MKPSPATTLLLPVAASLNEATTRTAGVLPLRGSVPLLGFGLADTPEVAGPWLSVPSVIVVNAPQLPAASRA